MAELYELVIKLELWEKLDMTKKEITALHSNYRSKYVRRKSELSNDKTNINSFDDTIASLSRFIGYKIDRFKTTLSEWNGILKDVTKMSKSLKKK